MNANLGSYLRQMRERAQPEQRGLPAGGARRVPGLRREEVAALAGVSQTYYTRLEQSHTAHASPQVLLSIARALELSDDERDYLLKIGSAEQPGQPRPAQDGQLGVPARMLLASLDGVAAAVLNYRCDIVGWNPLFHSLLAPHLDFALTDDPELRPNIIKLNFLDEKVRSLYADWRTESEANVAYLRFISGAHRHDRRFAELIGELIIRSSEFGNLWPRQDVANCVEGTKLFHHPVVGELDLMYQSAQLPDGNILKFYHAEPDSPHEASLRLLREDRRY
ncbi:MULTISPECIES: helix-turn-helix transcriptional regulator [unclassified Streptomyces]|uniref:helix-turn-helix transcriptional regulator n=1 Tax=unclassified Streptomyces TaxID=2593676 RepID=UPI001F53F12B|nr:MULTISPECIES: helix-turn-helix transcriptional regulator [unclassified Streptomyces]